MKRKRQQQEERRRTLADLNLIGEAQRPAGVRRKGCLGLFGSVLVIGAAAVSIGLGLH
jgi:hypothetical protein